MVRTVGIAWKCAIDFGTKRTKMLIEPAMVPGYHVVLCGILDSFVEARRLKFHDPANLSALQLHTTYAGSKLMCLS